MKVSLTSLVFGATLATGCYSPRPMQYIGVEGCSYVKEQTETRMRVGIEPILNSNRSREIFGENVLGDSYFPIIICARNEGTGPVYMGQGSIKFYDSSNTMWVTVSGGNLSEEYKSSGFLIKMITPGIFKSFAVIGTNQENLARKEDFNSKVLTGECKIVPGQEYQTLSVFEQPKESNLDLEEALLHGRIKIIINTESQRFPIEFELRK